MANADRITQFIARINAMSLSDLVGQYHALVDDHPHAAESGTLKQLGHELHLIDTVGELKFGIVWKDTLEAA